MSLPVVLTEEVKLEFCLKDWEDADQIHAEELVRRLALRFPGMTIDRQKGDNHVQDGLDRLTNIGAPSVFLESHNAYFGNVIFVSITQDRWNGAMACSYLYSIWPSLGDRVLFNVKGSIDQGTIDMIGQDLKAAMELVFCWEVRQGLNRPD